VSREGKEAGVAGREARLARLFNRDENAVIVAVDHGFFDGPIPGMVRIDETLAKIDACVDGVLLSPGILARSSDVFGYKGAPLAVVRLNWSSHFCFEWGYRQGAAVRAIGAAEAVQLGADAALICLTLVTGSEERDARGVELFSKLRAESHALGLPVIGEYFPGNVAELSAGELHAQVRNGCRIVAELGADCVKTFQTEKFPEVVAGCPIPVLGLGAEKTPTQLEALGLARREIDEGARGVVFGRNAVQVPDPPAFQRALCEVVKRGADPAEAARRFGLED
jgi:class I fructose-bisphosphate aldolase/fructose-bisphosphate aldolase/2-amino-3,7-dideoxy-D-threo-hept-6-ulosonate synthase